MVAREVFEEEPRDAPWRMAAMLVVVVVVAGVRWDIDVHVFRARDECAQVIGEIFEWACVVYAKERDDVREARRCAVPLFFGQVVAGAIEEHAETARRAAALLWWGWIQETVGSDSIALTEDERRVGLFEPGEVPKVRCLTELVASRGGSGSRV